MLLPFPQATGHSRLRSQLPPDIQPQASCPDPPGLQDRLVTAGQLSQVPLTLGV